jgi:hypothetical protein
MPCLLTRKCRATATRLRLYCESLDALGVRWTRPCDKQIAVYRKASVAILDQFIGPKR